MLVDCHFERDAVTGLHILNACQATDVHENIPRALAVHVGLDKARAPLVVPVQNDPMPCSFRKRVILRDASCRWPTVARASVRRSHFHRHVLVPLRVPLDLIQHQVVFSHACIAVEQGRAVEEQLLRRAVHGHDEAEAFVIVPPLDLANRH